MRVLFLTEVSDPGVGSSTRQMYQVARQLRELGHETHCIGTTTKADEVGEFVVEGMGLTRLHSSYPLRLRGVVSLRNPQITKGVAQTIARFRPDVVHAHLIHTHLGYHSLTQARLAGAGVVFTAHDVMVFCYQKLTCFHGGEARGGQDNDVVARASKCIPCQRFRFRPGRNLAIAKVLERDVERFTVVSDALGDVIRANGITVHGTVHNAIELSAELPSAADLAAFREERGLTGRPLLAMGGRLHEQKGVVKLFEMMAILRAEFPDLGLLVMGKRDLYDQEFQAKAAALGVDQMVVPTGWLSGSELACAYGAADVFVTPSICFDTFGLVNLEAMEQSRPVVATSFGGSCEVVQDGVSGFIANPFDVAGYAEKIACLLRDSNRATAMGEAGRRRLEEHFTIPRLTEEFLEHYEAARSARATR
jgi:glycosyltransferase involved in cell wall biosynthesis